MAAGADANSELSTPGNHPRPCICSCSFPLKEAGFLEGFYFVEYKRAMLDYVGSTIEHNEGLVWEFR